jgi:hypothetical protein
MVVRNVWNCSPNDTASRPRISSYLTEPLW